MLPGWDVFDKEQPFAKMEAHVVGSPNAVCMFQCEELFSVFHLGIFLSELQVGWDKLLLNLANVCDGCREMCLLGCLARSCFFVVVE